MAVNNEVRINLITFCLLVITAVLTTAALFVMRPVLVPFVFSLFLFFLVSPVINWSKRVLHIPKSLMIIAAMLLLSLGFFLAVIVLGESLKQFIQSSGEYQENLIVLLDNTSAYFESYGYTLDLSMVRQYLLNLPILNWVTSFSGGVVGIVGNLILTFIFTFFLVIGSETNESKEILHTEVRSRITRYIATKCFTSGLTGFLIWIVLMLFNVKLAIMFAILTFVLNFVPSVGSIIATLLPIPVLMLQFGYSWELLIIIIITGAAQFLIGNILDPKLLGENLGMNPVLILLSLLFWGFIWGVPGMFLSVPMTAIIKLALNRAQFKNRLNSMLQEMIT